MKIESMIGASDVKLMFEGMQLITNKTGGCINFVEKNSSDPFWVKIIRNTGCWSYVIIQFLFYLSFFEI